MMLVAAFYISVHSPGNHEIILNAETIVLMREGEGKGEYVTGKTRCIITTNDGKFVSVIETCAEVRRLINGKQ